jgi:hypothetical protein
MHLQAEVWQEKRLGELGMNLKSKVLGVVAATAIGISLMAPVATAQYAGDSTGDNTTAITVNIETAGVFNVYFTQASFALDEVTLNAANPSGVATGELVIEYEDTKADRPAFDVTLTSSRFSNNAAPNSGNANMQISAEGFSVTKTYTVAQTQWSSGVGYSIGDIGYYVNNGYVANTGPNQSDGVWAPGSNDLGYGATVQFGYSGIGTIASWGQVDVALEVPSTTVGGAYTSTMTLTVVAGSQP